MLCMTQIHFTDTRARKIISSYSQRIEHHGPFVVITMVPHACIQEDDGDLLTSHEKMTRKMQCMSGNIVWVYMRESI